MQFFLFIAACAVCPEGTSPSWRECVQAEDADLDGWTVAEGDCDDADPQVHPGQVDVVGDGVDSDCDGEDGDPGLADPGWQSVDCGPEGCCAVDREGALRCWGSVMGPPSGDFQQVSLGLSHACALDGEGEVRCWGLAAGGRLVAPPGPWVGVSVGGDFSCAWSDAGRVACWGVDTAGETAPPVASLWDIAAGRWHACGLRDGGRVSCWGLNTDGQAHPGGQLQVEKLAAGMFHSCGVNAEGAVQCWGIDDGSACCDFGQSTDTPKDRFSMVAAGDLFTCGLTLDGQARCWGHDDAGQVSGAPDEPLRLLVAGADRACGVAESDGALRCWPPLEGLP